MGVYYLATSSRKESPNREGQQHERHVKEASWALNFTALYGCWAFKQPNNMYIYYSIEDHWATVTNQGHLACVLFTATHATR